MQRFISWLMRWTIEVFDDPRDADWKRDEATKPKTRPRND